MNYEEDIKIDAEALDVEWIDQAMLMLKYAKHAAETRREVNSAKEALELAKAELDKDIRTHPEEYGIEKITDKVVENTVPMQKKFQIASQKFIAAKFEDDIAQGATRAVDARKDALENLVRLHGQQYFAGPKVPRDLNKELQNKRKEREVKDKSMNKDMIRTLRRDH